jgi:hypothetical protein
MIEELAERREGGSLFLLFNFKKCMEEHGIFLAIARNRVALLPMIERVLTAFSGQQIPKKAYCLQAALGDSTLFLFAGFRSKSCE